ncbi:nitronate monooxygenase, partial [Natrinema soli]
MQASIGSATTPELAAAVSNAGGLGHLAVNLVCDDATTIVDTDEHLKVILESGADVVTLSFGEAAPFVDRIHEAGALAFQTVGSAAAAREAVAAGVDAVVTQGL